jgi:hypothetical protein
MRFAIIGTFVLALAVLIAPTALVASADAPSMAAGTAPITAVKVDVDLPKVDIDVDVHKERAWYKNPIVIGVGAVVVILLIALASRGGTTIIDRRS